MPRRRKPTYVPQPRYLTKYQVACLLNMSVPTFEARRVRLEELGFPREDRFMGGWDGEAIEHFCDARSGLIESAGVESADLLDALEKFGNGPR